MTVCLAAFAARCQAIVMCSDKAVTYGNGRMPAMQSDTDVVKAQEIGKTGWMAMISGNPAFAHDVFRECNTRLTTEPSMSEMLKLMTDSYSAVRDRWAEQAVLFPRLMTRSLLVARERTFLPLPDDMTTELSHSLATYSPNTRLLICGFDGRAKRTPHIFTVENPGRTSDLDAEGIGAIGMGAHTALGRLLTSEVGRDDPLDEALYEVFDAKATAEVIQGIGYEWDGWIMTKHGHKRLPNPIKRIIENVFFDYNSSPFTKRKKRYRNNKWRKELQERVSDFLQQIERQSNRRLKRT